MKKVLEFINNNINKLILIVFSVLAVNMIFYILVGSKALINSDSTFFIDYALEQIETKSIFPTTWVHTNDFWFYSLIPIITPLIKLGVNFFISRQIAVLVQTILFFLLLYDFYKKLFDDKKGAIIMFVIFLTGVSGQFMSEMYGDASYGTVVIFMLLELWLLFNYMKSDYKKKKYLVIFTALLAFLTSCSFRFPIYIAAPIICILLYFCYSDGFKKKYLKILGLVGVALIVGVIGNSILKSNLLFNDNYGDNAPIVESKELSKNIGKTFHDYLFLCGATGKNVHSLTLHLTNDFVKGSSSPFIVLNFIKFVYALVTLIIPFMLFKKIKLMTNIEKGLLIYVSSFSFIMLFFLTIGNMAWWHRYIFTVVFVLNLLYPMYYKYYFDKKKNNRIIFKLGLTLVAIASFIFTTGSYINLKENRLRTNDYQYLAEYFEKNNLTLGYANAAIETNLFRTITNGKVQVLRMSYDGKGINYWIVSTRWYKRDYHDGKVFYYRLKDDEEIELEKKAIEKREVGQFVIFIFENNDVVLDYLGNRCDDCI